MPELNPYADMNAALDHQVRHLESLEHIDDYLADILSW